MHQRTQTRPKLQWNRRQKTHEPQCGTSDSECAALFCFTFYKKALDSPTVLLYEDKSIQTSHGIQFFPQVGTANVTYGLGSGPSGYYLNTGVCPISASHFNLVLFLFDPHPKDAELGQGLYGWAIGSAVCLVCVAADVTMARLCTKAEGTLSLAGKIRTSTNKPKCTLKQSAAGDPAAL